MFSAKLKERIERERQEEEEHIAEVRGYAESVMAKKREEQEAKARAEEKRRKEAEETQKTLDRIQWITDMSDFVEMGHIGCKSLVCPYFFTIFVKIDINIYKIWGLKDKICCAILARIKKICII